ncbi:T6SS immunity protein Tdi1 domain-containing protein [Pseudomonas batumici]|uniref:T6SS immunity protein Tdi1 domain-containing protein n=1 Tax=Pseudomonas batumici TaxID=226910 RepID=UPI0030CC40CE
MSIGNHANFHAGHRNGLEVDSQCMLNAEHMNPSSVITETKWTAADMGLIEEIEKAWGWTGIKPSLIVGENEFGNFIIKDTTGCYWRLCPEELYCHRVANTRAELDDLSQSQDFLHDWYMKGLVEMAKARLGLLRPGYKYHLKIPAVLGGGYEEENLAMISLAELVNVSGYLAKEIDGLPDGAKVRLQVTE